MTDTDEESLKILDAELEESDSDSEELLACGN